MGIKTVPQPSYSPDLGPCDLCLFPKLRCCRYETNEAVTKVIDTLRQEDVHVSFQKLLERYSRRRLEFHVCTINKSAHTKKKSGNLFNDPRIYIYIYIYIYVCFNLYVCTIHVLFNFGLNLCIIFFLYLKHLVVVRLIYCHYFEFISITLV